MAESAKHYILGIDLGANTLGWAAIALGPGGAPSGMLDAGVRHFKAGVTGLVSKGQDISNAVARREARGVRRQFQRRAARQKALFRLLQEQGLLPAYEGEKTEGCEKRDAVINALDRELVKHWRADGGAPAALAVPCYLLRKMALDTILEAHELGRIFYHLSQRRGYKSNRKTPATGKKNDELGVVQRGIEELEAAMRSAGARTLGEYFFSLDPHQQRIRGRWTARKMYEDEFAAIWEKQAAFYPELLTDDLRKQIAHLLFYQRPLKSQSFLIGKCELEPGNRRAPWATLEAQRFRILERVNNLEIILPRQVHSMPLTAEQRLAVMDLLDHAETVTFEKIRKRLGLDKNAGFNLQRGGETRLKGSVTNQVMAGAFEDRWEGMSEEEKKQVVEDWRTIDSDEALKRRLMEDWRLDEAGAQWLIGKTPPPGYSNLSRKAIRKLLPAMEEGKHFAEALSEVYGNRQSGGRVYDRLPPVRDVLSTLRNPAVERALTEMRKVVNALIGVHGRPWRVCVELGRDLKKPRHERAEAVRVNRDRERQRLAAKERILKEVGLPHPSRADVDKALLWEECQGECPFTGKRFPFSSLFAENPPLRVVHILPLSRVLDDSFQNKVLSTHQAAMQRGNRTPFESSEGEEYEAILGRLRGWPKANIGKIKRFELRTLEELEGFSERQLNDTRYSSKMAAKLLEALYGGRYEESHGRNRQAVFSSSGTVTGTLRRAWGLDAVLHTLAPADRGRDRGNPRNDYRHCAIDAVVVALSDRHLIEQLSRDSEMERALPGTGGSRFKIQQPWKDFVASVRPLIERMLVSHRQEHKLAGAIHEETNYGRPYEVEDKTLVRLRRTVVGLSASEIENIVEPSVRAAVKQKAAEHGGDLTGWKPKPGQEDWPVLEGKAGLKTPIKKVRVEQCLKVETIGKKGHERHVSLGDNHHIEIFAVPDARKQGERWKWRIVSLYHAMERKRKKQPVVSTTLAGEPGAVFCFSLMKSDMLLLHRGCDHDKEFCAPTIWQVRSLWENGTVTLVRHSDARQINEIKAAKDWLLLSGDSLRKVQATKVCVDSLGRLQKAGG